MWNVSNRAVNRICCMKSSLSLLFVLLGLFCHGQNLIPRPERADKREGEFLVAKQTEIYSPAFPDLFDYLNDHIERVCGYRLAAGGHRRSIQQISIEKHEGGLSDPGERPGRSVLCAANPVSTDAGIGLPAGRRATCRNVRDPLFSYRGCAPFRLPGRYARRVS